MKLIQVKSWNHNTVLILIGEMETIVRLYANLGTAQQEPFFLTDANELIEIHILNLTGAVIHLLSLRNRKHMHLLLAKVGNGARLRLIRYAVDYAFDGKSVLYVTNELNPHEITAAIYACTTGIHRQSATKNITIIEGTSPYDVISEAKERNSDVVVIDSAYLLTNRNPNNYFILKKGLKAKTAIISEYCTQESGNGRIIPAYDRSIEYMDNISYLERDEDGTFVETNLVGKNKNETTEFVLDTTNIIGGIEVPYLRNA